MNHKKIEDLCRICANDSNFFKSIYDELVLGKFIYELIDDLCHLNVCSEDGLPEFVCPPCHWQLSEFQRFKDKSHQGQATLISIKMHMDQICIKEEPLDIEEDEVNTVRFQEPLENVASKFCDEEAEEILPDGGTVSCYADRIPKVEIVESLDFKTFIEIGQRSDNYNVTDSVPLLSSSIEDNQVQAEALVEIEQRSDNYNEITDTVPLQTSNIEDDQEQADSPQDHWEDDMDSANDEDLPCTSRLSSEESGMPCTELFNLSKMSHPLLSKPCQKRRGRAPSVDVSPSKQVRLEARRYKAQLRREQETPEQHEKRLKQQRDRQIQKIAKESPEDRALRLQRLRLNNRAHMVEESPIQREERLRKMRLSQSKRLARESREKRDERLLQLKLNQVKRLAGITEGNKRRGRGHSSMESPQFRGGSTPEENPKSSGDEADESRMSGRSPKSKASQRLSKGSCKYEEDLLGLPPDYFGTFEELLGPEEELKISVKRKRQSKCLKRKDYAVDPQSEAGETNVVTIDVSPEKNPFEVMSPDSGSHVRKNLESNSLGLVKDLAGANETVDTGSHPCPSPDNQVSMPLNISLSSVRMDSSSQGEDQPRGNCSPGAFPASSGINDPSDTATETSETKEDVTTTNCGRDTPKACLQFDEDLLRATGKGLANVEGHMHASNEMFMQNTSDADNVNENLKKSRPKRSSCRQVDYSEDAVARNYIGEISDTAEDQFIGTPDVVPEQWPRQGNLKVKYCANSFSSVDDSDISSVVERQAVDGPDMKPKQRARHKKSKKKGSPDDCVSERGSEILNTIENQALEGPDSKLKQPSSHKKNRKRRCSNTVASDGKSRVLEIAEKPTCSVLTLNLKNFTIQRESVRKYCSKAASIEGSFKVSDMVSGHKLDLRLSPVANREKPKKKHILESPVVEKGNSSLKSQALVVSDFSSMQALDLRNSVASSSQLKAQDSELGVSGGVVESGNGEEAVLQSTDDTGAKLNSPELLSSSLASDATVSSRFDTPSEVPVPCDLNGQSIGSFSSCNESAADVEKVIEKVLPGAVGSVEEVVSPVDTEIHAIVPVMDTGNCSKSFSTPSSSETNTGQLTMSENDNGLNVSSVSSGVDNLVGSGKPFTAVENESSLSSCDNNSLQLKSSVGHRKETFESLDKPFDISADDEASDSQVSLGPPLPHEEMVSDGCRGEELNNFESADIPKDIDSFLNSLAVGNTEVRCVDRVTPDQQCTEENGLPS